MPQAVSAALAPSSAAWSTRSLGVPTLCGSDTFLTVDYRHLEAKTAPSAKAAPNVSELITALQEQAHPFLAAIDA